WRTAKASIERGARNACSMSLPPPWPPTGPNGSIDNMPLKAQVAALTPKIRPRIACCRLDPRYGILVGLPAPRKRGDGDNIQRAIAIPRSAVTVPIPDDQMTTPVH